VYGVCVAQQQKLCDEVAKVQQLWVVGCDFEDYRDLFFVQGWLPNIKAGRVVTVETQNGLQQLVVVKF